MADSLILTEGSGSARPDNHQEGCGYLMTDRKSVLILCTGNSARSQMAEGLLRHDAGDRFVVSSAGTKPSQVRAEAIAAMHEAGIDISSQHSKSVDEFAGYAFDYVITVCDNARETCPVFPATTRRIHWSIEDPAAAQGSEEERLVQFRRVRDQLRSLLRQFAERQ
jgi:arsenate reductase (thioredoxin)